MKTYRRCVCRHTQIEELHERKPEILTLRATAAASEGRKLMFQKCLSLFYSGIFHGEVDITEKEAQIDTLESIYKLYICPQEFCFWEIHFMDKLTGISLVGW